MIKISIAILLGGVLNHFREQTLEIMIIRQIKTGSGTVNRRSLNLNYKGRGDVSVRRPLIIVMRWTLLLS